MKDVVNSKEVLKIDIMANNDMINHYESTIIKVGSKYKTIEEMIPFDKKNYNKILEQALRQERIQYTKPNQLIGKLEVVPDIVIPKYKILIFCEEECVSSVFNIRLGKADWVKIVLSKKQIVDNVKSCVNEVKRQIAKITSEMNHTFTFVDLFAGIGGFRIPLEELGGKCLGFSEIDKWAIQTYKRNFIDYNFCDELELGDIRTISQLPFNDVDIIVGGVPCQSWSVAGKMRGFDDPRGRLWHDAIRVVKHNKPKVFIFENVKGLIDPRNRENLRFITSSLEAIGYNIMKPQLMNSYDFGLPQNRERILIVGFRKDIDIEKVFEYPKPITKKTYLYNVIDDYNGLMEEVTKNKFDSKELHGGRVPKGRNKFQKENELNDFFIMCDTRNGHTTIHSWDIIETTEREKYICMTILKNRRKKIYGKADGNPISFDQLKCLIDNLREDELKKLIEKKILKQIDKKDYAFVNSKNSAGINGIYRIYLPHSNIFSTLTATGTKDMIALTDIVASSPKEYKEKFIEEIILKRQYRQISAKEAGKLQGFPYWFDVHNDENIAKKQFGNAVSIPVIYNLVLSIINTGVLKKR